MKKTRVFFQLMEKAITAPAYQTPVRLKAGVLCIPESDAQRAAFEALHLPSKEQCVNDAISSVQACLDAMDSAFNRSLTNFMAVENAVSEHLPKLLEAHESFQKELGEEAADTVFSETPINYYPIKEGGRSYPNIVLEALSDALLADNPDTIRGISTSWMRSVVLDGRILQTPPLEGFLTKSTTARPTELNITKASGEEMLGRFISQSNNRKLMETVQDQSFIRRFVARRRKTLDTLKVVQSRRFKEDTIAQLNRQVADQSTIVFGIASVANLVSHIGYNAYESAYAIHMAEAKYATNNHKH